MARVRPKSTQKDTRNAAECWADLPLCVHIAKCWSAPYSFLVTRRRLSANPAKALPEHTQMVSESWAGILAGIHIAKSWSDRCTFLVMKNFVMTPKAMHALIDQKDVVTPVYLEDLQRMQFLEVCSLAFVRDCHSVLDLKVGTNPRAVDASMLRKHHTFRT